MEELLGLPPMNNNDAFAPPIASLFTGAGEQQPYEADYRNRDNGLLYRANGPRGRVRRPRAGWISSTGTEPIPGY